MIKYLLILVIAFLLSVGATPWIRRLAVRLNIVDQPNARKIHRQPMPLMGGVAIYGAFIVALLALGDRHYVREVAGIFAGASLCSLMGLLDDRAGLSPLIKLSIQLIAAAILILSGVQIQALGNPVLNFGGTLLWVVGITNAFNLLDNMDGLTGGVGAIAAAFFLLLAAMSGQYLVGALAAALLGACIGFLVYNVNPASIFMGDSGSLFVGFMLAAVGIKLRFPDNVDFVTWMIPVIVLGIPIIDTTLVSISRLRQGKNPLTTPGKDHLSHRLVSLGHSRREAVLILYLGGCMLGVMAMYITQATVLEGYVMGGLAFVLALASLLRMLRVPPLPPSQPTADTVAEPADAEPAAIELDPQPESVGRHA